MGSIHNWVPSSTNKSCKLTEDDVGEQLIQFGNQSTYPVESFLCLNDWGQAECV